MLENQLYPTPEDVTDRMIAPWVGQWRGERDYLTSPKAGDDILDPQAGNGAILKRIYERFNRLHYDIKRDMYAVELDYQLRSVLTAEGFQVIGSDWIQYREPRKFSTIVSNPPFANGIDHFFKKLEHLAPGGRMACLLNAETVRNLCNDKRKFLLHRLCGFAAIPTPISLLSDPDPRDVENVLGQLEDAEVIEFFGQCFKGSERTTDVEVVCIRIELPEAKAWEPDWSEGNFKRHGYTPNPEEFRANPLAQRSAIKTMVAKYEAAVRALIKRWEIESEIRYYLSGLPGLAMQCHSNSDLKIDSSFKEQHTELKALFWQDLFTLTDIGNRIGSKTKKEFQKFAIDQAKLEFSEHNIMEMLQIIMANIDQAMNDLVVYCFDKLIGHHIDNKNFMEGWKTNSPDKIKKGKVIYPTRGMYDEWGWRKHYIPEFLDDLDKALCWVTGISLDVVKSKNGTIHQILCHHFDNIEANQCRHDHKLYTHFFEMRVYKKGTVHLKFRDGQIAKDFQVKAAAHRKWIGEQDNAETRAA